MTELVEALQAIDNTLHWILLVLWLLLLFKNMG